MDFLVSAAVFGGWVLLGHLTADYLAVLGGEAGPSWHLELAGQAFWPVLVPLLLYIWWTCE